MSRQLGLLRFRPNRSSHCTRNTSSEAEILLGNVEIFRYFAASALLTLCGRWCTVADISILRRALRVISARKVMILFVSGGLSKSIQ